MSNTSNQNTLVTICIFLIVASFTYVFVGLTGVNLPKYYPVLREWSIVGIDGAVSMGFYGKVLFTLLFATLSTYIYKIISKGREVNVDVLLGFTKATVFIGVFFFIAEEWHKWGIEKSEMASKAFFNYEFWFFLILSLIALYFVSLLISKKK